MKQKITVLTYHDISKGPDKLEMLSPIDRLYTICVKQLEKQADLINTGGYVALKIEEFIPCIKGEKLIAKKAVLFTFDDGHESNYTLTYPTLSSRGLSAVYFITAGNVGRAGYISWAQLSEIARAGNAVGSHGMTHSILKNMTRQEIHNELATSKKILEEHLGVEIKTLSIPRGFYSGTVIDVARESGYSAVFTSDSGYAGSVTNVYAIPRIVMRSDYTLKDYKAIINADIRFKIAKNVESAAKKLMQEILGVERYDHLKTKLLRLRNKK